jgi:hypothetical protein
MGVLKKHDKFDLRLSSQVKKVTHAPGNVTATYHHLKSRNNIHVTGTVAALLQLISQNQLLITRPSSQNVPNLFFV